LTLLGEQEAKQKTVDDEAIAAADRLRNQIKALSQMVAQEYVHFNYSFLVF
jgi:uncharacterized membrane protein